MLFSVFVCLEIALGIPGFCFLLVFLCFVQPSLITDQHLSVSVGSCDQPLTSFQPDQFNLTVQLCTRPILKPADKILINWAFFRFLASQLLMFQDHSQIVEAAIQSLFFGFSERVCLAALHFPDHRWCTSCSSLKLPLCLAILFLNVFLPL